MIYDADMKSIINSSFSQYAGAVIQSRALVDVRDCVKPSARQVYYNMFIDKYTSDRPFSKTLKVLGGCMKTYIHGDSSCEGIIMRSGQPFSLRYPLVEVEGSYGNLMESGNWAASRYTSSRLSKLSDFLVKETTHDTVDEWVDNYDDTMQYPRVLSSLGFYNIVNGSQGISVGIASSIPPFNIVEVNEALKKLLLNPDIDFEDILCYPDFPTGGTIINKNEIIDSLKNGQGKACVIRAKIKYSKKDNALVVSEIPYGVYTNTICNEIEKLVETNPEIGIVNINDLTGEKVNLKIYLAPRYKKDIESVQDVVSILFSKTSLQKSFSINMMMLENGRYPKIFGWKEALQAHLNHEQQTYIKLFSHKKKEFEDKLLIVNGILAAINNIDRVVNEIRCAESTKDASERLQNLLSINSTQAKSILDIKLVRLAKLEADKFESEKQNLESDIAKLTKILNSDKLLKKQMIKRFDKVAKLFGDERRTKVIQKKVEKAKPQKETENLVITFNPLGYLQSIPEERYKDNGLKSIHITSDDYIVLLSDKSKVYRISPKDIKKCGNKDKGTAIGTLLNLANDESILHICGKNNKTFLYTLLDGTVKRVNSEQFYGTTRNLRGMLVFKEEQDTYISECPDDCVITLHSKSKQISFKAKSVRPSGKGSGGICGMSLDKDDVIEYIEIENENDFSGKIQNRGGKGIKRIS